MIKVTKNTLSGFSLQNTEKKIAGAKRKSRHPASNKISFNMIGTVRIFRELYRGQIHIAEFYSGRSGCKVFEVR